jgi:hypothetical protein
MKNFDSIFYSNYYEDLKILNWSEEELKSHYENYVKKE